MALADCRECGKQISSEAPTCPHCGCPSPYVEMLTKPAAPKKQSKGLWVAIVTILFFMVLIKMEDSNVDQKEAHLTKNQQNKPSPPPFKLINPDAQWSFSYSDDKTTAFLETAALNNKNTKLKLLCYLNDSLISVNGADIANIKDKGKSVPVELSFDNAIMINDQIKTPGFFRAGGSLKNEEKTNTEFVALMKKHNQVSVTIKLGDKEKLSYLFPLKNFSRSYNTGCNNTNFAKAKESNQSQLQNRGSLFYIAKDSLMCTTKSTFDYQYKMLSQGHNRLTPGCSIAKGNINVITVDSGFSWEHVRDAETHTDYFVAREYVKSSY